MATDGEWRTITRRKQTPVDSNPAPPPRIQPFKPFHTRPTFADMVRRPSSSPAIGFKSSSTNGNNPSPKTLTNPVVYISPHSHAQLRFPPSSRYVEWKGRCFQCCRMGHNAALCRNPKRCGKCWGQGHIGSRCPTRQGHIGSSSSTMQGHGHGQRLTWEPSFADLLESPIVSKPMPKDRPQKSLVFVNRDDEYFQELAKLEGAVIMYNPNEEMDLTIEQVAMYAVRSNLVKVEDISISVLSKARYVIMLPSGLAPDTFIKAIPLDIWREGFSFYQWSTRDDATLAIPHFKVLIDLVGIPLNLFREKEIIRAMSSIGVFLGTVSQQKEGVIARWTVAVATTNLSLIPRQIGYMVGGLEIPVEVITKTWMHSPLYKETEVAQTKERYKPNVLAIPPPPTPLKEPGLMPDGESFHISRSVLLDLCRGKDPMQLPEEVRGAVLGQAMAEEQDAQLPIATIDPETQNTQKPATENLKSATIEEGEPELIPTFEFVPDTYEAGQRLQSCDSARVQQPQTIGDDSNRRSGFAQSNPNGLKDKSVAEFTINPPKILLRNKDTIEVGDSSKSRKSAPKVVTLYSLPKLRPSTRNKRQVQERARINRPKARKQAQRQARIVTQSDGLVEVQVNYEHVSNLANVLGFQPLQVQQALLQDNEDRAATSFEERNGVKQKEQTEEDISGETQLVEQEGAYNAEVSNAGPYWEARTAGPNEQTQEAGVKAGSEAGMKAGCQREDGRWEQEGSGCEHLTDFDPDSEDELSSGSD